MPLLPDAFKKSQLFSIGSQLGLKKYVGQKFLLCQPVALFCAFWLKIKSLNIADIFSFPDCPQISKIKRVIVVQTHVNDLIWGPPFLHSVSKDVTKVVDSFRSPPIKKKMFFEEARKITEYFSKKVT